MGLTAETLKIWLPNHITGVMRWSLQQRKCLLFTATIWGFFFFNQPFIFLVEKNVFLDEKLQPAENIC